MQLPYMPEDEHSLATMDFLRQYVVESGSSNMRLVAGTASITLSGTAVATQSVTFQDQTGAKAKPFLKGTTPFVVLSLTSALTHGTTALVSATSVTYQGFTIDADSSTAQNITVNWFALGQTE